MPGTTRQAGQSAQSGQSGQSAQSGQAGQAGQARPPVRGTAPRGSTAATDRLSRLLAMVPYLLEHPGTDLDVAAEQFAISTEQLVADLELLFVCGLPGHLPDDLIEAEWETGKVYLGNADAIARPLRLAVDEALALLVGLRTLADVPGLHDRDALERATAKLTAAAGEAAAAAAAVTVALEDGVTEQVLAASRDALDRRRRLHLTYLVPSRDESTERDVDPMRIVSVDAHWYLEGWCHRAQDVRLFRLDRVQAASVLDVDGTPPPSATSRDLADGLFRPDPADMLVTLDLAPGAHWVAEQYPVEHVQPAGQVGTPDILRVLVRTSDAHWLRRLVLRMGGAVRVVDPPNLAQQSVEAAREALAAYGQTAQDPPAGA